MSWKHWAAVIVVIGLGIVLQIPSHQTGTVSDHEHGQATGSTSSADEAGPFRTVALAVSGMT
jgi:hypothetical protein